MHVAVVNYTTQHAEEFLAVCVPLRPHVQQLKQKEMTGSLIGDAA
jgi:hypothetical protein